jgi:hypothetical protein
MALLGMCLLANGCASMIGGERTERLTETRTHKVKIESEPAGATVLLDGTEVGQTPLELSLTYDLETTARYADLHWAGYVLDVGWIFAYGAGIVFLIYDASVDGDLISSEVTPRRARHELLLRKEGYLDAARLVTAPTTRELAVTLTREPLVPAPGPVTPAPAPAERGKGRLSVRTFPPGAEIAIDALDFSYIKTAPTPLTHVTLRAGRYRIAVIDPRYRAAAQTIRVRPDDTAVVELSLTPRPGSTDQEEPEITGPSGSLLLLSHPDRQPVIVDGRPRGTTPLRLRLPVGLQPVEVGGVRFDVEVEAGGLRRLVVNTEQQTLTDLEAGEFAPQGSRRPRPR